MKHSGIRIPESTQLWALKRSAIRHTRLGDWNDVMWSKDIEGACVRKLCLCRSVPCMDTDWCATISRREHRLSVHYFASHQSDLESNLSRATAKNFVHSPIFEIAQTIFQEHNVRSKWRIFGRIFLLLTFHCDFTCKFLQPAMCRPQVVVHLDSKVWNPCEEVWTISRHSHAMSWPCWNAGHLPHPRRPSTPTIHANH